MHFLQPIIFLTLIILVHTQYQNTVYSFVNQQKCRTLTNVKSHHRLNGRMSLPEIPFETIDLVTKDPMKLFELWRNEAIALPNNSHPDAMSLATVKRGGSPSVRTVLLRGIDQRGYKIYTDYRSPKGMEIAGDNRGALVFVWVFQKPSGESGQRQVRIEGYIEKLSVRESQDYFESEPIIAQIRTAVQNQSRIITDNRNFLHRESHNLLEKYNRDPANFKIEMPTTWGGYRLVPNMMEFYQGTRDAFNDRIRFRKTNVLEQGGFVEPGVCPGANHWVYMQLEP